jgi:hypothetical protein
MTMRVPPVLGHSLHQNPFDVRFLRAAPGGVTGRWKAWLRLVGFAFAEGTFHRPVMPPPLGSAGMKKARLMIQAGFDADRFF